MEKFNATKFSYTILRQNNEIESQIHSLLRSDIGSESLFCVSPNHGRSFLISQEPVDEKYIVTKGNGLSYTTNRFINTGEYGANTWGLLLKKDALRDYDVGLEIKELGVKVNTMHSVIELDEEIHLPMMEIKPTLLQYSVECPYRICDIPFMTRSQVLNEVAKWESLNEFSFKEKYLIAANTLIKNLKILHNNKILHNAIHAHNYTWALELLDFELSCTPRHPYDTDDDMRHVNDLYSREILQTYEIIKYIALSLGECIDYKRVDDLFHYYDLDINMTDC